MSDSQSQTQNERPVKHIVADTLAETKHAAVAVVEKPVGSDTVTNYYVGLEQGYAEILPANPRAKRIKKFTLCQRIEGLPEGADVDIKAITQLDSNVQDDIEKKVTPLSEEDAMKREVAKEPSRGTPTSDKDKYGHAADNPHDTGAFEVASAPAGTSDEHGGGW